MTRRAKTIAMVAAAVIALAAGAFAHQRSTSMRDATGPTSSTASALFYAQRLRDARNDEVDLSRYRGRIVLVNFWATWCGPCVEEIPSFSKVHAEVGDRVAFIGLGIDSIGNVIGFNERFKPSYPLVAAGANGTELARAFGDEQGGLPFTLLLDGDGRVLEKRLGRLDEETLRAWIARHAASARA